jgi:hypothetical protein
MFDDEELEALDEWRFKLRMPSRAAAMRALMRFGLKLEVDVDDFDTNLATVPSNSIGLIDGGATDPEHLPEGMSAVGVDKELFEAVRAMAESQGISAADAVNEACKLALATWRNERPVPAGGLGNA